MKAILFNRHIFERAIANAGFQTDEQRKAFFASKGGGGGGGRAAAVSTHYKPPTAAQMQAALNQKAAADKATYAAAQAAVNAYFGIAPGAPPQAGSLPPNVGAYGGANFGLGDTELERRLRAYSSPSFRYDPNDPNGGENAPRGKTYPTPPPKPPQIPRLPGPKVPGGNTPPPNGGPIMGNPNGSWAQPGIDWSKIYPNLEKMPSPIGQRQSPPPTPRYGGGTKNPLPRPGSPTSDFGPKAPVSVQPMPKPNLPISLAGDARIVKPQVRSGPIPATQLRHVTQAINALSRRR